MATDLFGVIKGLNIQTDDFNLGAHVLVGSGLPGGDGAEQDAAPVGSIYLRTDPNTGKVQLFWKVSTTNNSNADWETAASQSYVDAVAAGLSWREPVRVLDSTSYADSSVFPTTGVVDGVTLNDQDRVLFTNVTATGQSNVWIWNASTLTWTEDTNQESDGDILAVQDGTHAEELWIYDGTSWILFNASGNTSEIGFIRQFVGKTGPGAELPTYSSTFVVTQSANLETAIGELDTTFGSGVVTNKTPNYPLTNDFTWAGGTLTLTDGFNNLNDAIGSRTYTNQNYITNGETLTLSLDKLDQQLGTVNNYHKQSTLTNVDASLGLTVDSIPLTDADEVKWIVRVRENAAPGNVYAAEIFAVTDGTNVDYTKYGVLRLGTAIPGIQVSVVLSGGALNLQVTATPLVDIIVRRVGYSKF